MGAPVIDITIVRGKTFEFSFRYAQAYLAYLDIEAMVSTAPVRLTITNHKIPDGWPVWIDGVKAPQDLNNDPDGKTPYYEASVIDADTIELNSVNAYSWKPFIPSGQVIFYRPIDLTGYAARMWIKDRVGGNILLKLDSDVSTAPAGVIAVDATLSAFIPKLSAAATAALTWRQGVYDFEAITPTGEVYAIAAVSRVTVADEVTE